MFLSEKFFMQAELCNGNIRPLQFLVSDKYI